MTLKTAYRNRPYIRIHIGSRVDVTIALVKYVLMTIMHVVRHSLVQMIACVLAAVDVISIMSVTIVDC